MSINKKIIRKNFRDACFKRDNYRCTMCGYKPSLDKIEKELDAHHIQDRHLMPFEGTVIENGITLCNKLNGCHWKAEQFHLTGTSIENYSPEDLYKKINSSYDKAFQASQKLNSNDN
jgi:predicted restriction endonuclease